MSVMYEKSETVKHNLEKKNFLLRKYFPKEFKVNDFLTLILIKLVRLLWSFDKKVIFI